MIPNALSEEQVRKLNDAIDHDRETFPRGWLQFNEALAQTSDILSRTSEFDFTIENPPTLGFMRKLIGEDVTFEEFLATIREPTARPHDFTGSRHQKRSDSGHALEVLAR